MKKVNLIIEFFLSCNSFVQFLVFLEFFEFLVVLFGFLCFNWMYYNHSITRKCKSYFKQLPLFNRIFVIWFSIFYAIPNKIFINNSFSTLSVAFSIFLIIVISNVFAPFILLYIIFWIIVLESYFFAMSYENSISFRKFINNKLFNGDELFAKEYFSFFWGNMNSGGAGRGAAGAVGTLIGGLFQLARNNEKTHIRVQGQIETHALIDKSTIKPRTAEDALAIQQRVENHILERDTVILKIEKHAQSFGKKAWDWFNHS